VTPQKGTDFLQELVAAGVTKRVVDTFEAVKV
jgi:hypothetical protein